MKITIYYKTKNESWGGGNQFLKALKELMRNRGVYSEKAKDADAILFNGYQEIAPLFFSWVFNNNKKRVYRLGPIMSLHRNGIKWVLVDYIVIACANLFADLVIFQSKWSYEKAREFGFYKNKIHVIILNGVNSRIFYKKEIKNTLQNKKIKLIYSSWSSNIKKGFTYLSFLDENLDFEKYEMTFVGNSPFSFKNIKKVNPLPSIELAQKLRESDVFISPTEDDACSNAILEALASDLPVVALASGGNAELIREAGVTFQNEKEILIAIEKVSTDLDFYRNQIKIKPLENIVDDYIEAIFCL